MAKRSKSDSTNSSEQQSTDDGVADATTSSCTISKKLKDGYKQRDTLLRGDKTDAMGQMLTRFEAPTGVDAHVLLPTMMVAMNFLLAPGARPACPVATGPPSR